MSRGIVLSSLQVDALEHKEDLTADCDDAWHRVLAPPHGLGKSSVRVFVGRHGVLVPVVAELHARAHTPFRFLLPLWIIRGVSPGYEQVGRWVIGSFRVFVPAAYDIIYMRGGVSEMDFFAF